MTFASRSLHSSSPKAVLSSRSRAVRLEAELFRFEADHAKRCVRRPVAPLSDARCSTDPLVRPADLPSSVLAPTAAGLAAAAVRVTPIQSAGVLTSGRVLVDAAESCCKQCAHARLLLLCVAFGMNQLRLSSVTPWRVHSSSLSTCPNARRMSSFGSTTC